MTESLQKNTPYQGLSPDLVLDAVESVGLQCDGRVMALNSYENRVYQVGLDENWVVTKFYRPFRWSDEAILEEHEFTLELAEAEIPVVAPMRIDGKTLFEFQGFRFAVFPRQGGRAPDLESKEHRQWLGRFMGRIHAMGRVRRFQHRQTLSVDLLGWQSLDTVLASGLLPPHMEEAYRTTVTDLVQHIESVWEGVGSFAMVRLHGDCHPGNILWTDHGPHFVDMDDCRNGPAIQDLWMLLNGDYDERSKQMSEILEGYEQFMAFDPMELMLIEPLRALRMINYAAWLAKRWDDPAFKQAFPWFESARYWEDHVLQLREQASALTEPVLQLS